MSSTFMFRAADQSGIPVAENDYKESEMFELYTVSGSLSLV